MQSLPTLKTFRADLGPVWWLRVTVTESLGKAASMVLQCSSPPPAHGSSWQLCPCVWCFGGVQGLEAYSGSLRRCWQDVGDRTCGERPLGSSLLSTAVCGPSDAPPSPPAPGSSPSLQLRFLGHCFHACYSSLSPLHLICSCLHMMSADLWLLPTLRGPLSSAAFC